jgi:DNA-binding transcriptional LysR family regulator
MNLNRMAVFAAVVEQGSFTAAGLALGLTKSMVSQHVAALEAELGVRLMQRTTRRLTLTSAGEVCLESCQRVAHEAKALGTRIQQLKHEPAGKLRVTVTVDYAISDFASKVTRFLALYPRVELELIVRDTVVDLVAERIDVALRMGWLRDSSLSASRVGEFEQVLVASPLYLASAAPIVRPSDLEKVDLVALSLLRRPREQVFTDAAGRRQKVQLASRLCADSPIAVQALAAQGAGIAVLAHYMVERDLSEGRLVRLLPAWSLPAGGIFAVTPSRRAPAPNVRALLEFLRAQRRR